MGDEGHAWGRTGLCFDLGFLGLSYCIPSTMLIIAGFRGPRKSLLVHQK